MNHFLVPIVIESWWSTNIAGTATLSSWLFSQDSMTFHFCECQCVGSVSLQRRQRQRSWQLSLSSLGQSLRFLVMTFTCWSLWQRRRRRDRVWTNRIAILIHEDKKEKRDTMMKGQDWKMNKLTSFFYAEELAEFEGMASNEIRAFLVTIWPWNLLIPCLWLQRLCARLRPTRQVPRHACQHFWFQVQIGKDSTVHTE